MYISFDKFYVSKKKKKKKEMANIYFQRVFNKIISLFRLLPQRSLATNGPEKLFPWEFDDITLKI